MKIIPLSFPCTDNIIDHAIGCKPGQGGGLKFDTAAQAGQGAAFVKLQCLHLALCELVAGCAAVRCGLHIRPCGVVFSGL